MGRRVTWGEGLWLLCAQKEAGGPGSAGDKRGQVCWGPEALAERPGRSLRCTR